MEENKSSESTKEATASQEAAMSSETIPSETEATKATGEQQKQQETAASILPVKDNLINLTIKTPKDKENVSVEATATVKEVLCVDFI